MMKNIRDIIKYIKFRFFKEPGKDIECIKSELELSLQKQHDYKCELEELSARISALSSEKYLWELKNNRIECNSCMKNNQDSAKSVQSFVRPMSRIKKVKDI